MGRVYRPVEVEYKGKSQITIALVDTGADETVISERLAKIIKANLYGVYSARCASQTVLEGKHTDVLIRELKSNKKTRIEVGVSDIPFDTDDINEEGLDVILGVDFIQETKLNL